MSTVSYTSWVVGASPVHVDNPIYFDAQNMVVDATLSVGLPRQGLVNPIFQIFKRDLRHM
jgi:hypothetical protein